MTFSCRSDLMKNTVLVLCFSSTHPFNFPNFSLHIFIFPTRMNFNLFPMFLLVLDVVVQAISFRITEYRVCFLLPHLPLRAIVRSQKAQSFIQTMTKHNLKIEFIIMSNGSGSFLFFMCRGDRNELLITRLKTSLYLPHLVENINSTKRLFKN